MFTKQKHEVLHLNPHMEIFLFHCLLSARKIQIKHIVFRSGKLFRQMRPIFAKLLFKIIEKGCKIKYFHVVDD